MTHFAESAKVILGAWAIAWALSYACWGIQPWFRLRRKQQIRRRERVRFSSDVNTDLVGYQVRQNYWFYFTWTVVWLVVLYDSPNEQTLWFGNLIVLAMVCSRLYRRTPFQKEQSYLLTDCGVWVFPERGGRPIWQREQESFVGWEETEGYRIDGSYVQLYRDSQLLLQFEYAPYDLEAVRQLLYDLGVQRLDVADRIWVAALDERAFHVLEDEICEKGWQLLDACKDDLQQLKVRPEFGVMRNMPGDRLLEEHARSWLQLNLLDVTTGERQAASSFPLWQSTGSVGFLIGVRGPELIDRLQRWIRSVLAEAARLQEEVVS